MILPVDPASVSVPEVSAEEVRRPPMEATLDPERSANATTNPCTVCAPLGAALVYRGIRGAMPLVHGGQGCATYIRRYLISHFREPMDIASSSFSEQATIFGGQGNLFAALDNVRQVYRPELVGIATTCLAETIGEDMAGLLRLYASQHAGEDLPALVQVAAASYAMTHQDGFHATVAAVVEALCPRPVEAASQPTADASTWRLEQLNVLGGMVSPADLRNLRRLVEGFALPAVLLPDYSETLDGPNLRRYAAIPAGGTTVEAIRSMSRSRATLTLGRCAPAKAGDHLERHFGVEHVRLGLPIGLRETDRLVEALRRITGQDVPGWLALERGRLLDAYVDGHKYVFAKRAVVVGDHDLVVGLCSFLSEIGIEVVLAGGGGRRGHLRERLLEVEPTLASAEIIEDADHRSLRLACERLRPDLVIGPSTCGPAARGLGIPHLRLGFPVHDRFGAGRIQHLGYHGATALFDAIVNLLLTRRQEASEVGYAYL